MLTVIGIVAFVLAILFSIAWHELGHMIPAKKFGVKVTQYMVGFGPTIWSKKKGDTEYGIKGIPLGGYIRMIGMFPPGPDGKVRASSTGRLAMLIEDARKQAQEEVLSPEDEKRTFYNLSVPKKVIVMMGGPVMNLILAAVLFTVLFVGFGTPSQNLTVSAVTPCTPTATAPSGQKTADGACPAGSVQSPAAAAGLQNGDTITALNGQPMDSWTQLSTAIRGSEAGPATITVDRNGETLVLPTTITVVNRAVIVDGKATDTIAAQGFLGMSPTQVLQPQPVTAVPGQMWDMTVRSVEALVAMPVKMIGVGQAAFGGDKRDPNGPIGVVGVSRISGEVAAAEQVPMQWKVAQFIGLVASLNLFLFLFNLIPVLPLDGGHVAGALWEGLRRQIAKFRHQPDPGPVDVARALPLAYGVAIVLVAMSGLLLFADVVNPVTLGG